MKTVLQVFQDQNTPNSFNHSYMAKFPDLSSFCHLHLFLSRFHIFMNTASACMHTYALMMATVLLLAPFESADN